MTLGGSTAEPVLFEAVILPHRSLSVRGRAWLIGLICLLGTLTGVRFWLIGAWPVVAFSAAEIGIAVLLLWLNARQARSSELLLLDPTALRIVRTTPAGQREERVLAAELDGYADYMTRVRFRLIPGVW